MLSIAKYFRIIIALIVTSPLNPTECIFNLAETKKNEVMRLINEYDQTDFDLEENERVEIQLFYQTVTIMSLIFL